jgi:hypothetical protein
MPDLEAGRDLDALIAERVMGLPVVARDWPCGWLDTRYQAASFPDHLSPDETDRGPVYTDAHSIWPPRTNDDLDGWGRYVSVQPVPFYSTDIAAAWGVVEYLQHGPDAWKYTLHLVVYPYGRTYAYFGLDRPDDSAWAEGNNRYDDQDVRIEYATPLAICRAALAALPTS